MSVWRRIAACVCCFGEREMNGGGVRGCCISCACTINAHVTLGSLLLRVGARVRRELPLNEWSPKLIRVLAALEWNRLWWTSNYKLSLLHEMQLTNSSWLPEISLISILVDDRYHGSYRVYGCKTSSFIAILCLFIVQRNYTPIKVITG